MISAKQINELNAFKAAETTVLTAYLELNQNPLAQFRALQNGSKYPKELRADFERIEQYLKSDSPCAGFKGLALFSSARFGLWQACALPEPVGCRLTLDERPYLRPLLSIASTYHRFGVLLVGPSRARFFEVFMGQIREYGELEAALDPAEPDLALRLKSRMDLITERLEGLSRNQSFTRLVLGSSPELSLSLVNHLQRSLQQNLALSPNLEPEMERDEVLATLSSCERESRRGKERLVVQRLIDCASNSGNGALGLEKTLEALQQGRVKTLVVKDGFARMGRSCSACGALYLLELKCLGCRRPTQAVFNLVSDMMQKVYDRGGDVIRLLTDTPLDNLGKIGAELSLAPINRNAPVAA